MKVNEGMIRAVNRKRGEKKITLQELSEVTGIGKVTLSTVLGGKRTEVRYSTIDKLNTWLYQFI